MVDSPKDVFPSNHSDEKNPLLERFAYLAREANMLKRVIEHVPYDEHPPDQYSILDLLSALRRIQVDYLLPLIQESQQADKVDYASIDTFYEQLDPTATEQTGVYEVLEEIEEKRSEALRHLETSDPDLWESRIAYKNGNESFHEAIERIIEFERSLLAEISDRVMNYSQQKSTQREIRQRRNQRDNSSS